MGSEQRLLRQELMQGLAAASLDVVRGHPRSLTVQQARLLNLAPWCYHAARPGSAHRQQLAADFAHYWTGQHRRVQALVGLLNAWHAEGIVPVAIKGLAMAHAVYAHPGARFSVDSDVLVTAAEAASIRELTVPGWSLYDPKGHRGDERRPFSLWHGESGTVVDVHVSLLAQFGFPTAFCQRFTQAIHAAATREQALRVDGQSATIRFPAPADLLMVLAANRAWGDRWKLKPHDYLDMALTINRFGLTERALLDRATALGIRSTWLQLLRDCNPFAQHFDPLATRVSPALRWRKRWCTAPGGLPPHVRVSVGRVQYAVPALWRLIQATPTFLGVIRDLRRNPTPEEASQTPPKGAADLSTRPWHLGQVEHAARWICHLLRPLMGLCAAGPCVVQSITLLRLMRKHGHAAIWNLGYREVPGATPVGHAWVEVVGRPCALSLEEHLHNRRFKVVYSHRVETPMASQLCSNP